MSVYIRRLERLRAAMAKENLDALYISNLTHVRYMTGFSGSAGAAVVTMDSQHFFSDRRYEEQSQKEVPDYKVHMVQRGYLDAIKELGLWANARRVGFESTDMTVASYQRMQSVFPGITWMGVTGVLERLGAVKDEEEIAALQKAIAITDEVFADILPLLKVGTSERDISAHVSFMMKMKGADGDSYEPIIASGPLSALPHARPTDRRLTPGDFIVMDFGALYKGYHADMTRTVVVGEPTAKHAEIYNIVLKAQQAGIAVAKADLPISELDKACRSVIDTAGYGSLFCHSTGHGIGLEVHTHPSVSPGNNEPLLENYVVTIEPGIYIAGWGGVRIEDDCWIRPGHCVPLNKAPKDTLIVVG